MCIDHKSKIFMTWIFQFVVMKSDWTFFYIDTNDK